MNLTVSGHHMNVTPAIRQHVENKLLPIERHGEHITHAEVTLIVERHLHKAEASIHVSGGDLLRPPNRMICMQRLTRWQRSWTGKSSNTRKNTEATNRCLKAATSCTTGSLH